MSFARISGILAALSLAEYSSFAQIMAPPPAPPIIGNGVSKKAGEAAITAQAAIAPFSIGEPTDEEQLYLELINRARANPAAEADRILALDEPHVLGALSFFGVDTNLFKTQMAAIAAQPPLSFSAKLISSARGQSQFQFDNGIQSHSGPGGNTLSDRLTAVGYSFASAGENVYSYANNVEHGHAGFEVDWGPGIGGMQTPAGHRSNIHSAQFAEVGVGIVNGNNTVGSNTPVGPEVVTQDFGTSQTQTTYITGVAYYDLNGNNFYNIGEGLSGVTVTVDGVSNFAITSASGGYSVPVPANHNYTVRFNAPGSAETAVAVSVAGNNLKLDYKPAYVAPTLTSSSTVFVGTPNALTFSKLGGATAYSARVYTFQNAAVEGAETVTNITFNTSAGYSPTSTAIKATGSAAFHLQHISGGVTAQTVELKAPILVQSGGLLTFKSQLGVAYAGGVGGGPEVARVEISTDDGKSWTSIWSQPGAVGDDFNTAGVEQTFTSHSVNLSAYVGKLIRVRFNFNVDRQILLTSDPNLGWFIDDVSFAGATQAVNATVTVLDNSGTFAFAPATAGGYGVQFAATAGTRAFPFGPLNTVTALANPPVFSMGTPAISGANVTLHFTRMSGSVIGVAVQSAASVSGPWTIETSANITGPVRDEYTAVLATNGGARFYRVISQ